MDFSKQIFPAFVDIKVGDSFAILQTGWGLKHYTKLTVQKLTPTRVYFDGYKNVYRLKDGHIVGKDYGNFYGVPWHESHDEYNKKVDRAQTISNIYGRIGDIRAEAFFNLPEEIYGLVNERADELFKALKDYLK